MTPQEAIKYIDDVLNSDYHCDESLGYQLTSDDFEWLEEAKKALCKQIPKIPIKKNPIVYQKDIDGQEHYAYEYHCPLCDRKVLFYDFYCLCGQRIKWGNPNKIAKEREYD